VTWIPRARGWLRTQGVAVRVRADEIVGTSVRGQFAAGCEFQATVEPHERASGDARHEGKNQDHSTDRSHEPSHRSTMPENLSVDVGGCLWPVSPARGRSRISARLRLDRIDAERPGRDSKNATNAPDRALRSAKPIMYLLEASHLALGRASWLSSRTELSMRPCIVGGEGFESQNSRRYTWRDHWSRIIPW